MRGKHVLITGHTGFKGSWLIAMLHFQGAKVSGLSLEPPVGGIFQLAELHEFLDYDFRQDIRDSAALTRLVQRISPDVVIHLAAQPLVLASYANPLETYEINVMGTLNVLQAVEATPSVQGTLIITTDKVYRQYPGVSKEYLESDPLGAADPYSTSKAMADLATQSWIASHPDLRIGIARAGNVIGGGDVANNRLMPDLVSAFSRSKSAIIRNPTSVRPWQHVLDCLSGYLAFSEFLTSGSRGLDIANFGPATNCSLTVSQVADIAKRVWGQKASWNPGDALPYHEAQYLTLDSELAKSKLGWAEKLSPHEAVKWTIQWERMVNSGAKPREVTMEQIERFLQY